ncbi:hypothetical protein FOXB_16028 [Fusarium oxysporum f. sp. conglutinans Fo5176]|uniref:Uncharacterized protein n=2 Tax=Fusarium oxysporum f. sp. conglutinans TaxID=100902 RepID=F9GBJ5_FUSOF|nr:hypothetical protein FOXB_16028 [Fusarium oxysporum f. sp. conglutinans Fo5176]
MQCHYWGMGTLRTPPLEVTTATNILFEQKKKKQKKKAPPIGSARDFPCRPCVTRATKSPGYECASQDSLSLLVQSLLILAMPGAPPQRAAQQLRACSAAPAPALAPRGEADEKTLEERKVAALEAIAEAARLWTQLNKPDEESVEEDEDGEDEDN